MPLRRYTVEDIFKDYGDRKAGVVRALTDDVDEFYRLCDPDKTWEVTPPPEDVPPKIPEPVLGINFARDGMEPRDWLSLVAVFSDSWLLSLASYLGACLNRNERERLFKLINDHPSVFEFVTEKKPLKDKPTVDSSSKPRGGTKDHLRFLNRVPLYTLSRAENSPGETFDITMTEKDQMYPLIILAL